MKKIFLIYLLTISVLKLSAQNKLTADPALPNKYAIVLYGEQVKSHTGNTQKMASHWANKGEGIYTWKKDLPEAGYYDIAISYAAKKEGSVMKIYSGKDSLITGLLPTAGYYPPDNQDWAAINFERRKVPGKIHFDKGSNEITIKLNSIDQVDLYAVDLVPESKKKVIKTDQKSLIPSRPDLQWFANAPYGVMFHWTSQSAPQKGPAKSYNDAVNAFDVGAFAKMVHKTGASYVIFTTNHAEPFFPAPLSVWEKEYPGHTTKRDLVEAIADSLQKYNIKLVLYLATHVYAKFDKVNDEEFKRLNYSLISAIGDRYKSKVAGFWLDGWYQCYTQHPAFDFTQFYKICKTGNPNRLLGLNFWLYPVGTLWQDYWAGEVYTIGNASKSQVLTQGPGMGLQSQHLVVMEKDDWLHSSLNTDIKTPDLNATDLLNFINQSKGKGPITINIQIYQDGRISDSALKVMETVKGQIKR